MQSILQTDQEKKPKKKRTPSLELRNHQRIDQPHIMTQGELGGLVKT
jgi:hypothetical protein